MLLLASNPISVLSSLTHIHPAKQPQQHSVSLNLRRVGGVGVASVPGSPARELSRLVQLQRDKLQALESRLLGCEAEMRDWEESAGEANDVSKTRVASAIPNTCTLNPCVFKSMRVYTKYRIALFSCNAVYVAVTVLISQLLNPYAAGYIPLWG